MKLPGVFKIISLGEVDENEKYVQRLSSLWKSIPGPSYSVRTPVIGCLVFEHEVIEANSEDDERKRDVTFEKIKLNKQAEKKVYILNWWFSFRNVLRLK